MKLASAILLGSSSLAVPAWAQADTGEASEQEVQPPAARADDQHDRTIVVTGARERGYRATVAPQVNRTDTLLQQVPFSVQVVTRDVIEDRGVTTFGEALRYTPGLSPQVGFSNTNEVFRIRGFVTNFIYKNGFRRSIYSVDNQLANIEQIEVLKGAASALFGRAEPGGVINIVTRRPQAQRFLDVGVTGGDFDAFRTTLDVNAPLSDDVGLRFNASFDDRGSYRDLAGSTTFFVAPVVVWRLAPDTTLTVEGEYSTLDSFPDRGYGNIPLFLTAPRERQFAGPDARLRRDGGLGAIYLEHRFSDAIRVRFAAQASQFTVRSLLYNYGFPAVSGAAGPNPRVNVTPNDTFDEQRNITVQGELYARFTTGPIAHQALIGVEHNSDNWDYVFLRGQPVSVDFRDPVFPGPAQGPFVLNFGGLEKASAEAIYFQDELALGDFRLLLGGRYDRSRASINAVGFGPPLINEREEDRFSPRAGLTYTPIPELSLYASYAQSFTPQLVRTRAGVSPAVEGEAIEAGVKLSLLGGRLTPTLAVFDIERSNVAQADPADPPFSILVGLSRSRGVEIELPAAITPQWRLVANYTYLDAEVVDDQTLPSGTRLLNAPDHAASLWTSYDFRGALDGLTLGAGVLHIGDRAANSADTINLPDYTRFDASAYYTLPTRFGPVRFQVSVLNISDEFYYDSGGSFLPLFPGAPRTITASVRVRL